MKTLSSLTMLYRIFITFLFLAGNLGGQTPARDFDEEIDFQSQAIDELNKEIKATRQRIARETRREKSAAQRINSLEEEISLLDRLVTELKREEEKTRRQIKSYEGDLTKKDDELTTVRKRYERRAVNTYKQGSLSGLEKVLSSTSWRQAVYRTRYLKLISDLDKKMQAQIRSLLIDIGQKKLQLETALRKNLNLKREKTKQRQILSNRKIAKAKELKRIRRSRADLASLLQEKQAGFKQLEAIRTGIIEDKSRFEREERIKRQQAALRAKSFVELQGKLLWPAEGRVIAKFGRQWNPKLKTTTENPGIDIKGKPGSSIRTVLNGIVTTITYIRGYGTTVIIDHGGGFYTVYSHVNKLQTSINSEVKGGDVIAYMGDSGSINGSKLHFEIWGKGQKLDPEKWLVKQ